MNLYLLLVRSCLHFRYESISVLLRHMLRLNGMVIGLCVGQICGPMTGGSTIVGQLGCIWTNALTPNYQGACYRHSEPSSNIRLGARLSPVSAADRQIRYRGIQMAEEKQRSLLLDSASRFPLPHGMRAPQPPAQSCDIR